MQEDAVIIGCLNERPQRNRHESEERDEEHQVNGDDLKASRFN